MAAASPTSGSSGALAKAVAAGEGTLSLRVVVRTPTVETFVQKYARFVKDDRIFVFTKSSQPPGTKLRFTLELADGRPLISGEGTVTRVRADASDPAKPSGMELRFSPTDDASRKIVGLLLAERQAATHPTEARPAPVPVGASLPVLPHTAAQPAYDPPEPVAAATPAAPIATEPYPALLPRGATPAGMESPLLRGSIVGQRTDLPRRPGGGRATLIGVAPPILTPAPTPSPTPAPTPSPAPSSASPLAALATTMIGHAPPASDLPRKLSPPPNQRSLALARTLALEPEARAELVPPTVSPPLADAATALMSAVPQSAPDATTALMNAAPPPEPGSVPAPSRSTLDADSLFATSGNSPAPEERNEHTQVDYVHVRPADDASFPGLGQTPSYEEAWRDPFGDVGNGLLPANPFSEVSDGAIEYFVEWSLERSTAPETPEQAATDAALKALGPLDKEATPPRRGFVGVLIGLGFGLVAGGVGVTLMRPRAYVESPAPRNEDRTPSLKTRPTSAVAHAPSEPPAPEHAAPVAAEAKPAAPLATKPATPAAPVAPAATAGKLIVTSQPKGGTVSLDGKDVGRAPLTLDVTAGQHEVAVRLDRYQTFTTMIDGAGTVDAELKRPRATLKVTSTPPGAAVIVNGEASGKTPASITVPAYEQYTVEVTAAPGRAWKKRVYVKAPVTAVQASVPPKGGPTATKPLPTKPAATPAKTAGAPSPLAPSPLAKPGDKPRR